MAGKLSSILITLLMINVIGYLLMGVAIAENYASKNPYISSNSMLATLYTPYQDMNNDTVYLIGNSSSIYGEVPTQTPSSLIQQGISFVDRIFVIFGFIKTILAVLVFPIALLNFMGMPYQLSMLFMTPLTLLYIIGFFDLISGGDN